MCKAIVCALAAVFVLSSCAVTETVRLSGSSSTSDTEIHVEQFFVDVLADFSQFMPESDESVMDSAVSQFAGQIDATDEGSGVLFVKTGENSWAGHFAFSDFEKLADELGGAEQSIIGQTSNSISFNCSIDNYKELEAIVPFLADPNISVYLAEYNIGYSEQDYMDMITFAIGEEAPDALRGSMITFDITLPGPVESVTGAEQTGPDSIRYSFPLIDFLLLAEPLSFSATWS